MRVNLFTSLGALKVGLDILMKEEHVQVDQILGHGVSSRQKVSARRSSQVPSTHRFPLWRQQERAEPGASHCWLLI